MKRFIYKCSGGNGDYYVGNILAKNKKEAEQKLEIRYHSILILDEFKPNGFEKAKSEGKINTVNNLE